MLVALVCMWLIAETPKQYGAGSDFDDGIYAEANESDAASEQPIAINRSRLFHAMRKVFQTLSAKDGIARRAVEPSSTIEVNACMASPSQSPAFGSVTYQAGAPESMGAA